MEKIEKLYLDAHLLATDPELVRRLEWIEEKINELVEVHNKLLAKLEEK